MNPNDLKRWANRGARPSRPSEPAPPSRRSEAAAPAQGLPAPPAGYQYILHGGVPMLVAIEAVAAPPPGHPLAYVPASRAGAAVIPILRVKNARLVRPLTKDGVLVPDPWDVAMSRAPDLTPDVARQMGLGQEWEALADPSDAVPSGEPLAPDNPFGNRPLSTATDLKPR